MRVFFKHHVVPLLGKRAPIDMDLHECLVFRPIEAQQPGGCVFMVLSRYEERMVNYELW